MLLALLSLIGRIISLIINSYIFIHISISIMLDILYVQELQNTGIDLYIISGRSEKCVGIQYNIF